MAQGRRERRILVVAGAAALVAVGLNLLVSAVKAHRQRRGKKRGALNLCSLLRSLCFLLRFLGDFADFMPNFAFCVSSFVLPDLAQCGRFARPSTLDPCADYMLGLVIVWVGLLLREKETTSCYAWMYIIIVRMIQLNSRHPSSCHLPGFPPLSW